MIPLPFTLTLRAFPNHLRAWQNQKKYHPTTIGIFERICPARETTIDGHPAFIIFECPTTGIAIAATPSDIDTAFKP